MPGVSKKRLLLVLGGIVVTAAIVVGIVLATRRHEDARPAQPVGDTVKLEIRAKPLATIKVAGRTLGRTPQVLVVKRSTTPIEIEATFLDEKFQFKTRDKITTYLRETRIVVPTDSQSVDFDVKDARPLDGKPADLK